MKKIITLFVLAISFQLFAQKALTIPLGYGIQSLGFSGVSGLKGDVSVLGSLNPASYTQFSNFSFGTSFQYSGKIEQSHILTSGVKANNNIPAEVSLILPYGNVFLGGGYEKIFNNELEYEKISIRSITGSVACEGPIYLPGVESNIDKYFGGLAYKMDDIIGGSLSIGAKICLLNIRSLTKIFHIDSEGDETEVGYELGLVYAISNKDFGNMQIGISYEPKVECRMFMKSSYSGPEELNIQDSETNEIWFEDFYSDANIPS